MKIERELTESEIKAITNLWASVPVDYSTIEELYRLLGSIDDVETILRHSEYLAVDPIELCTVIKSYGT